jgi:hypothetical protein
VQTPVVSGIPFLLTTKSEMYPAAQFNFHGKQPHINIISKILLAIKAMLVDYKRVIHITEP